MSASARSDLAVACRGVRKHFGEGEARVEALRGADFEARFGELSFLVGPSGCGKTTLISVIAGLLERTGGELDVLGTPVDRLRGAERVLFRRRNLGFLFQQYNLLPALTAAENVAVEARSGAGFESRNAGLGLERTPGPLARPSRGIRVRAVLGADDRGGAPAPHLRPSAGGESGTRSAWSPRRSDMASRA